MALVYVYRHAAPRLCSNTTGTHVEIVKCFHFVHVFGTLYTVSKTKHLAFDDLSTRRPTSKFTVRFLKGRYTTRVSNTCVILDTRVRRPCSRASVHTGYNPWTRPVDAACEHGSVYQDPWIRPDSRVHLLTAEHPLPRQSFLLTRPVDTGARYTLPVFTGRCW